MKSNRILFFIFLIAGTALSGCSKLDNLESRVQKLEEYANLPKGIIITTKSIENVKLGNIVAMDIIVNPSDFVLTEENLSLLTKHHLYTAINTRSVPETPFDSLAHSDLRIVGLTPDEDFEGAYTLAIAADGEGNFFDDIDAYVLYNATDNTGKMRRICSSSSISIHLIPEIQNAFNFEVPHQSFYKHGYEKGRFVDQGVKTQYVGMWMKRYKDASGAYRVYDRSRITSIVLETEGRDTTVSLNTDNFKTSGYFSMTIFSENDYWVKAVKDYKEKGIASVTYPQGHGITFSSSDGESVTFPLDTAKVYFKANYSQSKTVKYADLEQTMCIPYNVSSELQASGSDGSNEKLLNVKMSFGSGVGQGTAAVINTDFGNGVINLYFPYLYEHMKDKDFECFYYHNYIYSDIQDDRGLFVGGGESVPLLDFLMNMAYRITD